MPVYPWETVLVSYGGGVNSVALLLCLFDQGVRPRAITMADPGSEWPATHRYREEVMQPWLANHGWPVIEVISRQQEGALRERAWRLETLYEECERIQSLPSVAYGYKKCSLV